MTYGDWYYWWLQGWWPYAKERTSLNGMDLTPPVLANIEDSFRDKIRDRFLAKRGWICPDTTYLRAVKLPKSKLYKVKLICTNLMEADLSQAYLVKAILTAADLRNANLSQAKLYKTKFRGANLKGANLNGAIIGGADFRDATITQSQLYLTCIRKGRRPPILPEGCASGEPHLTSWGESR